MVRVVVFLLTVTLISTVSLSASAQSACFDIFSTPVEMPPAFKEQRSISNPADLKETGRFIEGSSGKGVQEVVELLALRDGTYPLIIDTNKNIMIEHRLPDPNVGANLPYLGTHRGLYAKLYTLTGHRPQIVFAGQIRVVGGKVINIIDQAGTFFQAIEDFKNFGDGAMGKLIEANQARLDYASHYLLQLGIITAQTEVINFRKQFRRYGSGLLNQGHTTARQAAEFERRCRRNPACAAQAETVDKYLRWVTAQGGRQFIMDNFMTFMNKDMRRGGEFIQWMTLFLGEGVFDVMSGANVLLNPKGDKGQQFTQFIEDLPVFLGPI